MHTPKRITCSLVVVSLLALAACDGSTAAFVPQQLELYAASGPHETVTELGSGPQGSLMIVRPRNLEQNAHHLVVWGSGFGTLPLVYLRTLEHLASHGFIVVSPSEAPVARQPDRLLDGVDWLLAQSRDADSQWHETLATQRACTTGYSIGAAAAILAGHDERIACTGALLPRPTTELSADLQGPLLVVSGGDDDSAPLTELQRTIFDPAGVETIWSVVEGADHLAGIRPTPAMLGYLTAWLSTHLRADQSARQLFYGADDECGICQHAGWDTRRKNIQ